MSGHDVVSCEVEAVGERVTIFVCDRRGCHARATSEGKLGDVPCPLERVSDE